MIILDILFNVNFVDGTIVHIHFAVRYSVILYHSYSVLRLVLFSPGIFDDLIAVEENLWRCNPFGVILVTTP